MQGSTRAGSKTDNNPKSLRSASQLELVVGRESYSSLIPYSSDKECFRIEGGEEFFSIEKMSFIKYRRDRERVK